MTPQERSTVPATDGLAEHDLAFLASDAARPARLLLEYLPPPMGVDPVQFYPYLSDFAGQIDVVLWNNHPLSSYARPERVWIDRRAAAGVADRSPGTSSHVPSPKR